ncbi:MULTISPECIES: hypothetical protein [unclassified Granulicatella]|uniref:hypothetical protein n=1 Tax=unclassified Granulicatella TaxID=2630493 RepID=UPI001073F716|nr:MULTISPECIES: hypothetical protein [unclassified Granulicatella]MBF0780231.1 hypothetical protein [Granulicatella sp. 19428wC4_WM01]TFU95665.1 hypothetical protein E4T68_03885 [Granulicatella sp. WM01]
MSKKKLLCRLGIASLLIGGGIVTTMALNGFSLNGTRQENYRKKQLNYLKEHEADMIAYIKKEYPKIESVQFDWSTFQVNAISNGWITTSGNKLSLKGKFNNLNNTRLRVEFYLENSEDIPNIKKIKLSDHPEIVTDNVWVPYE